ncbi:MAG: hypothetical protein F4X35_02085 [Alphaproteobacteria bacterium]|nr:hypothetical protein [Alphaproteobacteria bacterium]
MTSERTAAFHRINLLADRIGMDLDEFRFLAEQATGKRALVAMNDGQLEALEKHLRDFDTKGAAA